MFQYFIAFITLLSVFGIKPTTDPTVKELVTKWGIKINEYREHLIKKNPSSTLELRQLLMKWDSLKVSSDNKDYLIENILIGAGVYDYSYNDILKSIKKDYPESKLVGNLSERDYQTVLRNIELLNLIHLGVLKSVYPFGIAPGSQVFSEFINYKIGENDVVGEIGAGTGAFSLVLNRIQPNATIWINEIQEELLVHIIKLVNESSSLFNISKMKIVLGDKSSPNFEENEMDIIIIRNSFHHFKKKDRMLYGISRSLKSNGILYIKDPVKELDIDGDMCKEAMQKQALIDVVVKNGFKMEEEIFWGDQYLWKFVKK